MRDDKQCCKYQLLADELRKSIFRGTYIAGSHLPSIRVISKMSGYHPNTVQKACKLLTYEALIMSKGTLGYRVASDQEWIQSVRKEKLQVLVHKFVNEMNRINCHEDDVITLLMEAMKHGIDEDR